MTLDEAVAAYRQFKDDHILEGFEGLDAAVRDLLMAASRHCLHDLEYEAEIDRLFPERKEPTDDTPSPSN